MGEMTIEEARALLKSPIWPKVRDNFLATGEFTVKRYNLGIPVETVNKTLTLTCSPSGTVT